MKRVVFLTAAVALIGGFVTACDNHCDDSSMALMSYSLPLKSHTHHHHSSTGGGGGGDCH